MLKVAHAVMPMERTADWAKGRGPRRPIFPTFWKHVFMLVTQAVEYFLVNNTPQIEALIFYFLTNKLNFVLGMILLSNLAQMWREFWLKMINDALVEDQNWKKSLFF